MDKYKELIKDVADLIADTRRENYLLTCELERTKQALDAAEERIIKLVADRAAEKINWEKDSEPDA